MRQLLISFLVLSATLGSAAGSDRYPVKKRYVNQTGEIVTIGQAAQIAAIAPMPQRRALPPLRILPVLDTPVIAKPAPKAISLTSPTRSGLLGSINVDPSDWPSGRKCCVSGQPYFNEEPNS
jgi:hypothetical protein